MIHPNTWESWLKCQSENDYKTKTWKVAKFFHDNKNNKFTDKEVKDWMYRERIITINDMNAVRPKITNLIDKGFLIEDGSIYDEDTKRHVRKVTWKGNTADVQLSLI